MMRGVRVLRLCGALLGLFVGAQAFSAGEPEEEEFGRKWAEGAIEIPAPPQPENLIAFYVSAATDNRFFIDATTVTVSPDGVVRYVLVIETASGARSVSFEGMRCEARERRIYASGRPDGSWSRSRNAEWRQIRDAGSNRYHMALFAEYFCPEGVIVRSADEARDALRRGGHPDSRR